MSCPIKIKSLDHLKKQGALGESRIIKDVTKFNELNELLTNLASEKYNVLSPTNEKLFTSKSKYVQNVDGSYRYVLRAEPNDKLFNVLQIAVDEYKVVPIQYNNIDYTLKAIDILQSTKAKQVFEKGNKNNWSLDKILTELQIPKEQKQIILDKNTNDREEIITSLLADNSFVVEINIATKNEIGAKETYNPETGEVDIDNIEPDIDYIEEYDEDGNIIGMKPVLSEKGKKQLEEKPTQYYSNLTVPGGTNYTENKIETPAIIPSIQGHAAWVKRDGTDNGIGWFRSDEQIISERDKQSQVEGEKELQEAIEQGYAEPGMKLLSLNTGDGSKTRRILEVQSDLFQKGRDKNNLITYNDNFDEYREREFSVGGKDYSTPGGGYFFENGETIDRYKFIAAFRKFEDLQNLDNRDNQFLQLLNKDNNWVTFFVKSIIQDSAKKGYEKVLFPSGNTASKVEGHTTLEEFKKQREDKVKELEEKNNKYVASRFINDDNSYKKEFNTEKEAVKWVEDSNKYIKEDKWEYKKQDKYTSEIETLKQELADVESGKTQLSSIAKFYENTVTNILKKNYNINQITDEYGNTWNEVSLENIDTKILLKEVDFNDLLDAKQSEQLYLEELNTHEPFSNEEEHGTINEFILFNNQEGKENYKATEILENIIKNFDGFSEQSELFLKKARILLATTKATVKLVNDEELVNKDTFMQYDPTDNSIHISLNKLRLVSTNFAVHAFLHEVTHSVTIRAYHNPITAEQRLFRNLIDEAYKKYNTGYDRNSDFDSYGFSNQVEFIAEIFTNPSFIQEIKRRDELEKTNFWKQLIDYIRSLFNLSKSPKYNDLIEAITNITYTEQMNSKGQIFEIKNPIKDESKFTSLKTIDDKLNYTINKIEESLERNIQSLEFTKSIVKDENKSKNVERYIKDFNEILKEVQTFRVDNQLLAVTTFLNKMGNNINYIKRRVDNIDYSNKDDVKNVLGVYQDYLSTFAVINNIEDVISNIRTNLDTQSTITTEELDKIEDILKVSKGEYSYLEKRMYDILKRGMRSLLNDIKYFKNIEKKHRDRLFREHKDSKIPEDRETWVIDKMLNRDKQLIQDDLDEAILLLIEDPSFDTLGADVLFSSAINVSSPLIQIMNQILFDIKNDKNKIIQEANIELEDLFQKLSKEKVSTNPKDLYNNILEYDSKGQPFFKGDYSIKFYEEVQLKLMDLYKDLRETKNKLYTELNELETKYGKSNSIVINKKIEVSKIITSKNKIIEGIKKENIIFDDFGKAISPKDKWKSNINKLSSVEKDVINLIRKRLEQSHKNTFQQSPLIKFSFGTKFYELPKVTKTDLERILVDNGKGIVKDKLKDFTEIRPDDIGYETTIRTDIENNRLFNLRVHYRDKTGTFDHKNQSIDVFNLIRLETENSTMFKIRKESELLLKSLIDIAKNKEYYEKEGSNKLINLWSKKYNTINGKESNTYKMMNNIMEQKFYDIFNKSNIKLGKTDLNKTVKFINSSSAFLTLSLNLASGTANVINANAQLFLESFLPMKGGFINASGIAKANRIYGSNMMGILQDLTNPINKSFVNQVNEIFDISDSLNLTNSGFLKTNMIKAGFNTQSLQVFQSSGEHWIQSVTVMAVLDGIKALNVEGKYINKEGKVVTEKNAVSLLDMLEVDKVNGKIKMNDNVVYTTHSRLTKWNEGGKTNVDMLIRKKLYDTVGNYTELDQPEVMRHWGGKLMMLYRKYLIPMGQARFRGWESSFTDKDKLTEDEKRFSYALQENEEGNYISLIRYITTALKDHKYYLLSKPHWDRLSDYEKHNIKRATTEIILTMVILPLVLSLVKGLADGDDDEYLFFLAYQIRRLDTELSQYRSPAETFKMMRSPVPSARLIQSSISIFESAFTPWNWGEVYESGPNKGENKNIMRIKKQIPVVKEFQRTYEGLLQYQESTWGSGL